MQNVRRNGAQYNAHTDDYSDVGCIAIPTTRATDGWDISRS
jgi:hypothetical protein